MVNNLKSEYPVTIVSSGGITKEIVCTEIYNEDAEYLRQHQAIISMEVLNINIPVVYVEIPALYDESLDAPYEIIEFGDFDEEDSCAKAISRAVKAIKEDLTYEDQHRS